MRHGRAQEGGHAFAELGFSETVFVDDRETGALRIFTPAVELPLAGHPLVGTAWLLGSEMLRPPAGDVPTWSQGGLTWIRARPEWATLYDLAQLASVADVDAFATESQHRAAKAQANGFFDRSVVPVTDRNGLTVLERDEFIKPDTSVEGLANLKPSFQFHGDLGFDSVALEKYHWVEKIDHVHHAGNSSGIVDGAAVMAIGTEEVGTSLGLTPRARIISTAVSGADPTIMLTGPAPAARKALARAGLEVDDIDLWEINEAFAAVAMRFMQDMGIDHEITNVNGGAIAMGHPLGATGAMILGTLIDELQRRDLRRGLATLCVGGGMGIATVVELV